MQNSDIADALALAASLLELHGENSFKSRSYQAASFRIDKMKEPLAAKNLEELESTEGIGQSLAKKINQLVQTGTFAELDALLANTPSGVLEMMQIKGIGPKKVAVLWKELGLESTGELLYACNENRLLALKGFGAKTQEQIIKAIEFKIASKGQFLYPDAELSASVLKEFLLTAGITELYETGEFRRRCEIITLLEFVICTEDSPETVLAILDKAGYKSNLIKEVQYQIKGTTTEGIPFCLYFAEKKELTTVLWQTTGSPMHLSRMEQKVTELNALLATSETEEALYQKAGLHYAVPEMREAEHELRPLSDPAKSLLTLNDLQGILHNHSTWSDGIHSLEEMALGCRALSKTYLGICDHSRSAVYAGGLSIEKVFAQHEEINLLNRKLAPFQIFKGIESDILTDGSLDYPDEVLSTFDFVVASIHSGFRMDQAKATSRLIKAIENPFTTILGHCTGRLLLSRPGYPIDHKAVIDACAASGVIIELNAHPYRLDIDWHWVDYALSKNVMISVNPDAHSVEGYRNLYYGVNAARKGGLTREMTFNAQPPEFIKAWFDKRKSRALAGRV